MGHHVYNGTSHHVYNPISQSQRHDPYGIYLRGWLPELERVPAEFIYEPWKMPAEVQRSAGCVIGVDYPAPMVDHAEARQRALSAYGKSG